MIDKLGII